jgi:hypothetical protein
MADDKNAAEREVELREHEREARDRERAERDPEERDQERDKPAPPGNVEQPRG